VSHTVIVTEVQKHTSNWILN